MPTFSRPLFATLATLFGVVSAIAAPTGVPPKVAVPATRPAAATPVPPPMPATAAPEAARAPTLISPPVPSPTERLVHLPSIGRETRLSGERDRLVWPVFLAAEEALLPARLRLAWETGVPVLPDASRLRVFVNDRPIADVGVGTDPSERTVDLVLPAGLVEPGWNAIRIEAEARHRIDCSPDATFELWTRIDTARSGLVLPTDRIRRSSLADLASLDPGTDGRRRIRLVLPKATEDAAAVARAFRLAEALALASGFLDPIVSVTRAPEPGAGLDVIFERTAGRPAVTGSAPVPSIDEADPSHAVLPMPDDAAAIDRLIADLAATTTVSGSKAGRAARTALAGRAIDSGGRITLAEIGVVERAFSGRLLRTAFDLRLPADVAPGDYGKVELKLVGGHAPGLDRTSRLTVRVDGHIVVGLPLTSADGEVFADRTLHLPFSAFRPGANRVEIEARVTTPADRSTCDTTAAREAPPRFLLGPATEIGFPTFARAARVPDLSATGAGVLAVLAPEERPVVHLPRADAASLSAAATLLARIATTAGRVQDLAVSFRAPEEHGSALLFATAADLTRGAVEPVGLDPEVLGDLWGIRAGTDARIARPTDARIAAAFAASAPPRTVDPVVTGSLTGRGVFDGVRRDDPLADWRRSSEKAWSPAVITRDLGTRIEHLFRPNRPHRADGTAGLVLSGTTGLVLAQAQTADGSRTVAVAATSERLLAGVTALTGPAWIGLEGAAWASDESGAAPSIAAAGSVDYRPTRGFDAGDLRRLAALRAAEHPATLALSAIGAAMALGFATDRLLRRGRESRR